MVSRIKSVKPSLWLKEGGYKEPVVAPTVYTSNKNASHLAALQNIVITRNNTEEIT